VISALTKPAHTINVPPQTVKCEVQRENDEVKPLTATLAPKLVFKNGRADKVWINLTDIDGPADIKTTVWAAAKLEDSLGLFHRPLIKSINKFMFRQCAKRYGPEALANEALQQKKADLAAKAATGALKAPAGEKATAAGQ